MLRAEREDMGCPRYVLMEVLGEDSEEEGREEGVLGMENWMSVVEVFAITGMLLLLRSSLAHLNLSVRYLKLGYSLFQARFTFRPTPHTSDHTWKSNRRNSLNQWVPYSAAGLSQHILVLRVHFIIRNAV